MSNRWANTTADTINLFPITTTDAANWPVSGSGPAGTIVPFQLSSFQEELLREELRLSQNQPGQIVRRDPEREVQWYPGGKAPDIPSIPMAPNTRKRKIQLRD